MALWSWLRGRARSLKRETLALYFAARDPRTPLIAKIIAGAVVAYALSPIDLIPDFVPILGYLDDVIIVPLGIALALRLIPDDVLAQSRKRAETVASKPRSYTAAIVVIVLWLLIGAVVCTWLYRVFFPKHLLS